MNGQCIPRQPNGTACSYDEACESRRCVDGVCCNAPCAGPCDVCAASLGASADGVCTVLPAGTPNCGTYVCNGTSGYCPTWCTSDANCAGGSFCNAQGACVPKLDLGARCDAANECASGYCVDGVCCDTACDGGCEACTASLGASEDGTCTVLPAGTSCGPYLCDGESGTCLSSCESDADCAEGNFCTAENACVPKLALGESCRAANECASGYCVDGVCCESACDGQCARCDAPGSAGTCTATVGAPVGDRPACASDGSACGGSCDGANLDACSYPGADVACGEPSCDEGVFVRHACDGQGSCEARSESCAPYACGADGCLTSCSRDVDCI